MHPLWVAVVDEIHETVDISAVLTRRRPFVGNCLRLSSGEI